MTTQPSKSYILNLQQHYEDYFGTTGKKCIYKNGPKEKLHNDFFVLEFRPNKIHGFWIYCSVGMSLDRKDNNLVEIFVFSPRQDDAQIELIVACASYHRNVMPLNLHHTINIGRPWLGNSKCDHGFISLPYLNGEALELFKFRDRTYHCYWLILIRQNERDYKIENGYEALEQLFEDKKLDYLEHERPCLIAK